MLFTEIQRKVIEIDVLVILPVRRSVELNSYNIFNEISDNDLSVRYCHGTHSPRPEAGKSEHSFRSPYVAKA